MTTLGQAYRAVRDSFRRAGLATPELDARALVAAASGIAAQRLVVEDGQTLDAGQAAELERLTRARLDRAPVGRILGHREFWGLDFALSAETLEPRPDTETLVEAALRHVEASGGRARKLRFADLGTGTGAILTALLSELPQAEGVGIDLSAGALRTARRNAEANGVGARARFVCGSWLQALAGDWDFIVANPPYIRSAVLAGLEPEVRCHDPALALDGGADGLAAYRAIVPASRPRLAARRGGLLLEIGFDQGEAVAAICRDEGFPQVDITRDLTDLNRVVTAHAG